ncbi:hypothetical protein V2J09_000770 [Rumex salicifolius]
MEESNSVLIPIVPGTKVRKDEGGMKVNATFYKQLVGSMMYATTTRLDIMYAISLISKFMAAPTELHLMIAKRILSSSTLTYKDGSMLITDGQHKARIT